MAQTQTIILTACPNGISSGGKPRLSVHIAPRLVPSGALGHLQDFGDWLVWPNITLTPWTVRFGPGAGLAVGANVVGVVLNGVDVRAAHEYSYSYDPGHGRQELQGTGKVVA